MGRSKSQCSAERVDRIVEKENGCLKNWLPCDLTPKRRRKKGREIWRAGTGGIGIGRTWRGQEKRERREWKKRTEQAGSTIIVIYVVQEGEIKVTITVQAALNWMKWNEQQGVNFVWLWFLSKTGTSSETTDLVWALLSAPT